MIHLKLVAFLAWSQVVMGSMQDCWNPEKLARMNFKQTPGTYLKQK